MNIEPILLVEDNEDDVFIFKRVYRQTKLPFPIEVVSDGQEAIDYLTGAGSFADRATFPLPFLVFLDLKLPLKHGLEVLQVIRANSGSADTCVIVLTSSAEARDISRAQDLGAQAFLVKPPQADVVAAAVSGARGRMAAPEAASRLRIAGNMFDDPVFGELRASLRGV